MIIAGGSYLERCAYPTWDRLFGSGLRAALALHSMSPTPSLHTYASPEYRADIEATLNSTGIVAQMINCPGEMVFEWLHPFQLLRWPDAPTGPCPLMKVEGDAVLRFGMIEGSARVKAGRAVYDPQYETEGFRGNGSEAHELVMIVSERDLTRLMYGHNYPNPQLVRKGIRDLFELEGSRYKFFAIILKDNLGGLRVFLDDEPRDVPTYAAESFFKIGAGDVLAAAFAHAWAERGLEILTAADQAARALAWFVEGARLPLPAERELPRRRCGPVPGRVRILGADTLEMGQLLVKTDDWVRTLGVETVIDWFNELRIDAIPTLVLVGDSTEFRTLRDMASATAGAPHVVVFSSNERTNLTARLFPGATVTSDYASALFQLLREPRQ